ncbi:adenosylhomocysteinase 1, partial [Tanacetum coccineum]
RLKKVKEESKVLHYLYFLDYGSGQLKHLAVEEGNEKETRKYKNEKANAILDMPKHLYEKVVALHLGKLGAKITKLTKDQSYYLSIPILTSLLPTCTDQRGYLLFGKMTSKNLWDCIGSTIMLLSDT